MELTFPYQIQIPRAMIPLQAMSLMSSQYPPRAMIPLQAMSLMGSQYPPRAMIPLLAMSLQFLLQMTSPANQSKESLPTRRGWQSINLMESTSPYQVQIRPKVPFISAAVFKEKLPLGRVIELI
jgi:hypothetical protein